MSKVRSIIYMSVKENFESLYGSLSEHESFTGLKFSEASIRVVGFETKDVLNTNLQRYYLLPRNQYVSEFGSVNIISLICPSREGQRTNVSLISSTEASKSDGEYRRFA